MRMWMVDPKIMCQKHLCGEHLELHMFIGTLKKRIKVNGYLINNCLEPRSIFLRHQEISNEMIRRGYNHKSPIDEIDCECVLYLSNEQQYWQIKRHDSLTELLKRCPDCYKRSLI